MRLYQEEYEMLMENIQVNGYKKTEYLLACMAAANKNSMQTAYRKCYTEHQHAEKKLEKPLKQERNRYSRYSHNRLQAEAE